MSLPYSNQSACFKIYRETRRALGVFSVDEVLAMSDDTAVGISLEFAKCENSNDSCHGTVELDSDHGTDTVAATVLQNKKCKSNADDSIPNSSHESNYAHHFTGKHTGRKYWQIVSVFSSFIVNMFYGGLAASYGVMYSYMKEPLGVSEEEVTWFGSLFGGFIGIACK